MDAERLAPRLRGDLLPTGWIPPAAVREARERIRHRGHLVWERTGVTNRLLALLARRNLQPTAGQRWSTVPGQRELKALPLTPIPPTIRADGLALRRLLDEQIRRLDQALVARWGDDVRVRRLVTIPGIGPFLAILVVLELADISRFPSAKPRASAIGLTPRVRASAGSVRVGPSSTEGNRLLRWALVLAATQAARRPGPLRTWDSAGPAAEGQKGRLRGPGAATRGDLRPGMEGGDRLSGGASSRWRAGVSSDDHLGLGPY